MAEAADSSGYGLARAGADGTFPAPELAYQPPQPRGGRTPIGLIG